MLLILSSGAMAAAQDASKAGPPEVGQGEPQYAEATVSHEQNKDTQRNANKGSPSDAKELSGMSIVGNEDAPKSLYIVPWKSSDIGAQTGLDTMLNEGDMPVDRDVFQRQIEFYQISTGK